MRTFKLLPLLLFFVVSAFGQNAKMDAFVSGLMGKISLGEIMADSIDGVTIVTG